ncbi:MAG: ATP-binding protein [bacterium]|nr:ATP-binding protein [bacterium]
MLDAKGNVLSWNKGAQRLKGYKPKEIIGKHISIFYPEVDIKNKKPETELKVATAKGRIKDEGWRLRKDGTRFWASVIITALFDKKGVHQGFAEVTRDLTDHKKHEDTLSETNEMLQASYDELLILNSTKDEFVSLASHQLRTPATGVKQYLGLLIEGYAGELSERQMDYLQKANQSNDRQIEIVNDLLQVAQLDAGKVILNRAKTDIGNMIADIIDEQIDSFKMRKQIVEFRLLDEPLFAEIDPARLRMVLENLIDNASKYTPEKGKIKVKITDNKSDIAISISDTGVGIAKKDQASLFGKFIRIPNELANSVHGSGLGLYWADKVVRLHGGSIQVESDAGKGSTFTVSLPKGNDHA